MASKRKTSATSKPSASKIKAAKVGRVKQVVNRVKSLPMTLVKRVKSLPKNVKSNLEGVLGAKKSATKPKAQSKSVGAKKSKRTKPRTVNDRRHFK
jgi:hypothetical protein